MPMNSANSFDDEMGIMQEKASHHRKACIGFFGLFGLTYIVKAKSFGVPPKTNYSTTEGKEFPIDVLHPAFGRK